MNPDNGYSLSFLKKEREQLRKDCEAFTKAYDLIRMRVQESEAAGKRNPEPRQWSGTCAVIGALELACHAIERTIVEYDVLIKRVESGELQNRDKPTLEVIRGGD